MSDIIDRLRKRIPLRTRIKVLNEMVIQSLNNFKESGSTYLLATEQWWLKENYELTQKELDMGCGYRPINLEITPFFLGKPLETHIENDGIDEGRNIGLWKIN